MQSQLLKYFENTVYKHKKEIVFTLQLHFYYVLQRNKFNP